jgi:protein tyrosine phosphatase (PTP) superfamily phosphohydrolase (DUF442 family)
MGGQQRVGSTTKPEFPDNEARETAQDTMKTIADKRPDLMASAQPAITKPVIVAKQTGMSLHATPAAPRPTLMTL